MRKALLFGLMLLLLVGSVNAVVLSFTSNSTWTAPATMIITAECWGGGGGGTSSNKDTQQPVGFPSGGGGSYAYKNITVIRGTTYNITVGSGGPGGAIKESGVNIGIKGGDSWFGSATTVFAIGGNGGGANLGGLGGDSASNFGSTAYSGGDGHSSTPVVSPGGGGGAGSTGVGGDAEDNIPGTGTALNGGDGGAGRTSISPSNPGSNYGGGGAGAITDGIFFGFAGGAGAPGYVVLTYTIPPRLSFFGTIKMILKGVFKLKVR